eukprot:TRINITY_DN11657_c0_g1_i1.p1 TRINITY_DN11657_c0_g1~~TRINITY_DN11657_c0_g1_i1.p1  ORF type:complete len:604 (+),score=274.56 TRINITY_DN11657_c0_g1_i1:126-1937(+)
MASSSNEEIAVPTLPVNFQNDGANNNDEAFFSDPASTSGPLSGGNAQRQWSEGPHEGGSHVPSTGGSFGGPVQTMPLHRGQSSTSAIVHPADVEIEKLKDVASQPKDDFADLPEASAASQHLKNSMINCPNAIERETVEIKEQAMAVAASKKESSEIREKLDFDIKTIEGDIRGLKERQRTSETNQDKIKAKISRMDKDMKANTANLQRAEKQGLKPSVPIDNGGMYFRFLAGRGETAVKLQIIITRAKNICAIDPKTWSQGDEDDPLSLKFLLQEVEHNERVIEDAKAEIVVLTKLVKSLERGDWYRGEMTLKEIIGMVEAATQDHTAMKKKLLIEEDRRVNYEACVDEFMKEQARLIEWCRAQKETLSQLPATENVQEFCSSLQGRIPMMEENFTVLTGMADDLIPGAQQKLIEKTLVDVRRVWIDLQVFSYERLRDALLEEHARSGLKEESHRFSSWAQGNVKAFMDTVEELLRTPDEQESQGIVKPVLEMCKNLQADYAPHQLIVDHVSDFDVRMEVINDHYRYLKKTITSPPTFLCQKLNAFEKGYARKEEYDDKMRDLNDWVDIRLANSASLHALQDKILEVRATVESELESDRLSA